MISARWLRGYDDLWLSDVDLGQLVNVVLNRPINARNALRHSRRLTIETSNATIDHEIAAAQANGEISKYLLLEVSKTGTGMVEDVIAQAFELFFTTKDVGNGSSLGMSMIYDL